MSTTSQDKLFEIAMDEVRSTIKRLPAPLRKRAEHVVVDYELVPMEAVVELGFDRTILGLFSGPTSMDDAGFSEAPLPASISLYLMNIWKYALKRERLFRREVRRTYLHELGHYLGFNEADIAARGLE